MSKSNQIQLSDHFTTGRLLKFTASPIIMMIFTSIYTIVDGFFVSNCAGKTAFTALNLIYPYLQMLGCLGFMIGTGGSALVAMTLGMGDEKRANRLFSMLAVATVASARFSASSAWHCCGPWRCCWAQRPSCCPAVCCMAAFC